MIVLLELPGARLVLEGDLSPSQAARARKLWARAARFIAPPLRDLVAEALEADDPAPIPGVGIGRRATRL